MDYAAPSFRRTRLHLWRGLALPVALVAVWEMICRLGLVDPLLLPPPSAVVTRGAWLLARGGLVADLAASAWRVLAGFACAALLALPLGIALGLWPALNGLTGSLISLLRPLSPPAWIPLAILWFGIGDAPAIFIIFVGTFFTLLVGTAAAARSVDAELVKSALTLGASRLQALRHVVLPALVPSLLAQMRIGLGLAWMCVIASEMVAVHRGLGFRMMEARNLFRTVDVLAGMGLVAAVGLVTDRLIALLESRVCRWREGLHPGQLVAGPGISG